MKHMHKLILITGLTSLTVLTILSLTIFCLRRRRKGENGCRDVESAFEREGDDMVNTEDLLKFHGGEHLTVRRILDAPGEVIGKSSYGTLYRADLVNSNSLAWLRFLRPTCTLGMKEVATIVELLGSIRHPNLVPLNAFYAGHRGEKLMVHPFCGNGNLSQFIKDGSSEIRQWPVIYRTSIGIAKGLRHLHSALEKPIIHGNLKSNNILLDTGHYHPYVSDFGLHLLLNPNAAQKVLEASASQGYKAPELIKMKDATKESDIYSLGVIFLELLSGKLAIGDNTVPDERVVDERVGFLQLAVACCSPSHLLRPDINQVLAKLQEMGI